MAAGTLTAYEQKALAITALRAFNYFSITAGEIAPLTTLAGLRAVMAARTFTDPAATAAATRALADFDLCIDKGLGISDAQVAASNTPAAFEALFTAINSEAIATDNAVINYQR